MAGGIRCSLLVAGVVLGAAVPESSAQITLADDIILAAQGKENAERNRESELGRKPGSSANPYRRSPGSSEIQLGIDQNRRVSTTERLSRRPGDPSAYRLPSAIPSTPSQGEARSTNRSTDFPSYGGLEEELPDDDETEREQGLTLDEAIERYVRYNRDLRTKFLELPQAEADILTASLRTNPLLFYSSDGVPYGSYSKTRPGEINHELSVVLPIDFSGKRRRRTAVAEHEKRILDSQYQDAVRLGIDEVYAAYVDFLEARYAVRAAEQSLHNLNSLLNDVETRSRDSAEAETDQDDLTIAVEFATISLNNQKSRLGDAKHRLGNLLDLTTEEEDQLDFREGLTVRVPFTPSYDALNPLACCNRPDLVALRLGVERARAMQARERAERFSDAYFLYTPFEYRDVSQNGELSSQSWGAGLFVSAPLFNRNQGNIRRARLNVEQTQIEVVSFERKVQAELRKAVKGFEESHDLLKRLERVTLPAVRRKRTKALDRFRKGSISAEELLAVQQTTSALIRYRRSALARHRLDSLRLNTAVGMRVVP